LGQARLAAVEAMLTMSPDAVEGTLDGVVRLRRVADVELHAFGAHAVGAQARQQVVQGGGTDVGRHDVGAGSGQRIGQCGAEPAGGAGDEGGFALQGAWRSGEGRLGHAGS
jgi:hypothetical protein